MKNTNDIFVFGSNEAGRHGAGAAKRAVTAYGAIYGQGWGLQGRSFAIPTKDKQIKTLPLDKIYKYGIEFLQFSVVHTEYTFYMTKIGCGLAGYKDEDIAPMFYCGDMFVHNIVFPVEWKPLFDKEDLFARNYYEGNL
jgi:hypothetical protein